LLAPLAAASLSATTPPAAAGAATAAPAPTAWAATAAPVPAGSATGSAATADVEAAACPSPGSCVGVGYYRTSSGPAAYGPLVERYTSAGWSDLAAPLPPDAATGTHEYGDLDAVSCASPSWCVAAGTYAGTTGRHFGLLEVVSGSTVAAAEAPEPPGAGTGTDQSAGIESVACPTAGACTAVGYYEDDQGRQGGLIDTLAATAWSAAAAPEPAGAGSGTSRYAAMSSVSCPSADWCAAAGTYGVAAGGTAGFVVTLSGATWVATAAPGPGPGTSGYGAVRSVSCAAPGECAAVGEYTDATGHDHGLVTSLSAAVWTVSAAPEPPGAGSGTDGYAGLGSVSCPATASCVAVGTYEDSTGQDLGLVETGSGTQWAPAPAPEPSGAATGTAGASALRSVSCAAPGACASAGVFASATHRTLAMVDTLSAGSWAAAGTPEPAGAGESKKQSSSLDTVACVGGGCVAGGSYQTTAGGTQGLLETEGMTPSGYLEAASDGGIFAYTVPFLGSEGGKTLVAPVVASAADTLTGGYYEAAADGGVFAFTAPFLGSMGGKPLVKPIVGMAFDTRTGGYYEVASDGGIFAFTAPFLGSEGGKPLVAPIVGMAFDPATGGYYEVASDGGIFAFTAPFLGSEGGKTLDKPVVGMAYDSLTGGYYEVASDGGLFAFTAPFLGSEGGKTLVAPVVGMGYDWGTGGYDEVAADGGIFAFTAPFLGSEGGKTLDKPVVTVAVG